MGGYVEKEMNLEIDYNNDMEYWEGERYSGYGIRRMKAYKSNLKIDQLQKRRDFFWKLKLKTNNENRTNWSLIQKAIAMDEPRDIHYLKHFGIEPINGCINELKDKNGNIYKVPNYCINDPYFEREMKDNGEEQIENEKKEIRIYRYGNPKPFFLKVSFDMTGKDLKKECIQHENLNEDKKIRLFIYGIEIKDEQCLSQHNISEDKPIYLII